jgi:hypothetical protein
MYPPPGRSPDLLPDKKTKNIDFSV